MTRRCAFMIPLALICLWGLIWVGCSDNTVTNVVPADQYDGGSDATYFLPINEGFTVVYSLAFADGSDDMVSLRVGRQTQVGVLPAVEWISDGTDGIDSGYIVVSADAFFFYDGANADAEKILQMPLAAGNTWERFSDEYSGDEFIDIITGFHEEDSTGITEPTVSKAFPSTGGNVMTVAGFEEIELECGLYFSNAVKVYNDGSVPGKRNYYWYVANIGLVKYILGATDGSYPRGDVTGELIDYGVQ